MEPIGLVLVVDEAGQPDALTPSFLGRLSCVSLSLAAGAVDKPTASAVHGCGISQPGADLPQCQRLLWWVIVHNRDRARRTE